MLVFAAVVAAALILVVILVVVLVVKVLLLVALTHISYCFQSGCWVSLCRLCWASSLPMVEIWTDNLSAAAEPPAQR